MLPHRFITILGLACCLPLLQAQYANDSILPPALPWDGASKKLAVAKDSPWVTAFETSDMTASPSYAETVAWLEKLAAASPHLKMVTIGRSWQGRDIVMMIASSDGAFTPQALKASGKPLFLAQAGIHSGEIDGKDAGMMLLRDMTVRGTKTSLLAQVNFLFIPILSADGHERASKTNRINQRGPDVMGWRTNARNLNLNRDYAKLETPGVRAVIGVINTYGPDLYYDLHVTDGIDYQYDITYGYNATQGHSPAIHKWMTAHLQPEADRHLSRMGHIPGPLVFAVDNSDPEKGIVEFTPGPRFSNGYGDFRHLPTVLVENHSLKPYDQRVLGTYVLLEATFQVLAKKGTSLRQAIAADRKTRPRQVALSWTASPEPPQKIPFLGVAYEKRTSPWTGGTYLRWLGKPQNQQIPFIKVDHPQASVTRPAGYWVPPTWPEVIEKLASHGILMSRLAEPKDIQATVYHIQNPKTAPSAFEGRVRQSGDPQTRAQTVRLAPGSAWVSCNQPLGTLAIALLEPAGPDSFFQWGYFHEIMQRTEYLEAYVAEPMIAQMLAADADLKARFEKKRAEDADFAKNPNAIRAWFYRQSPYFDQAWQIYPVVRVEASSY